MEIVNVSEGVQPWNWVSPTFDEAPSRPSAMHFRHASIHDSKLARWWPKRYASSRVIAAARGSRWAADTLESVLVTHGPRLSFYAEASMAARGRRARHLAFTFTFTDLPTGLERRLMARALRGVDRFVSFSSIEPAMYAEYFDLPVERFEWQHWAVAPPLVQGDTPVIAGDYICALGIQARDYASLAAAMRRLPAVRLVLVATPPSVAGLELPPNVELVHGIPLGRAMNILAHSRLTVVPLRGRRVPCGHSTLVPAMHLAKPIVVTDSAGVGDYVVDGETGLTVPPLDPAALCRAIERLHDEPTLATSLGQRAQRFAGVNCTEAVTAAWFGRYLQAGA